MTGSTSRATGHTTGEDLDIERHEQLVAYLRSTGRVAAGAEVTCRTLSGGVSNRAVWVEPDDGTAWVLKQALAKLRVKDEWLSEPRRIGREVEGLRHLSQLAPPGTTTPLLFEDPAVHLLAMRAVPHPHENLKTVLLAGVLPRARLLGLCGALGSLLGTIHANAWRRADDVRPAFEDRSFFQSLRIDPYYRATATREPAAREFIADLIDHTQAAQLTLTHGDYSPKNVLVCPACEAGAGGEERLVLLDHEVIHWGDPAFDVGFALAHLLSKAHHVAGRRADFRDAAVRFWESYRDGICGPGGSGQISWAAAIEPWCVRHALGCLLARVSGKSPLEYLDDAERARQRAAVLVLLKGPAVSVAGLADAFVAELLRIR